VKPANTVLSGLGTTVFEVMSRLAREHEAVNLGQGFPDDAGPDDLREAAARAVVEGWNQYPPMLGQPELRRAVAAHDRAFYGLDVDPDAEVMVTSGATEALAAALLALIEPGDEVVLFEPTYDAYLPMVRRAGGVPRLVSLVPPDWRVTREALAAAFSPRTKAVLLNDPQNPSAKVFSRAELGLIAEAAIDADAVAICDEVYEHIVFDGRAHVPLMTVPGMRERCLKIGSAGKTFSLTGWKVGYVTAAPDLIRTVAKAHQFLVFTTPPSLQSAVAFGLGKERAFFDGLAAEMQRRRDRLAGGLRALGLAVLDCGGTYFLNVDLTASGVTETDEAFCRRMIEQGGVAGIPVGGFYAGDGPQSLVRLCFSKQDAVLDAAIDRLGRFLGRA